ncbi:MAG: ABC transporter ATP-binding protein [Rhodospirillaceae bacterium]|nr:ABC transporter ATP-binding protein [Rhodospirillaceae bacterium]
MIELSNIHLRLPSLAGEVHILRGIDLSLAAGEAAALVGPSGSGKSTLMMVLAGLERPSEGTVAVAGQELTAMDEDALALFRRDNIGIVFQNFHLVPTMTALENVAMPLEFAGRADAFDLAESGLDQVGLSHRLTHYPAQLSGGEQQRVALARACAARPRLILADEPTGNLDGDTGGAVMDLLFRLRDGLDLTLLLITHETGLAGRCGRIVRMADGRIADPGVDRDLAPAEAAE